MTGIRGQAALWLGLALVATLIAMVPRVATALSEIIVGTIARLLIGATIGSALLAGGDAYRVCQPFGLREAPRRSMMAGASTVAA